MSPLSSLSVCLSCYLLIIPVTNSITSSSHTQYVTHTLPHHCRSLLLTIIISFLLLSLSLSPSPPIILSGGLVKVMPLDCFLFYLFLSWLLFAGSYLSIYILPTSLTLALLRSMLLVSLPSMAPPVSYLVGFILLSCSPLLPDNAAGAGAGEREDGWHTLLILLDILAFI
ncbi:hypothetical protein QBC46DRAFT_28957 [Diplogelasinospora grovesii]|uniref:Uncharacterized protein n=1 Tax=Diplogelasinospora grovesii TaxID=303347 RepID=A0AAN6NHD0_9PEZI|nr:hypothetical protein QBC46DRAFT_28957 [Diplogelasinospora grovesii]